MAHATWTLKADRAAPERPARNDEAITRSGLRAIALMTLLMFAVIGGGTIAANTASHDSVRRSTPVGVNVPAPIPAPAPAEFLAP